MQCIINAKKLQDNAKVLWLAIQKNTLALSKNLCALIFLQAGAC